MNTKKRITGILVLGSAIVGAACVARWHSGSTPPARAEGAPSGLSRTRAASAPLRCALKPDQRIGLTLRSRTTTGSSQRAREPGGEGEITLSGEMDLRVLSAADEAEGRSFTIAGVLTHPELTAAGRRVDDLSTALAEPVLFRLDDTCRITAFAAPGSMLPGARNQWKMTLKLLEFAVPAPGTARSWTTTQSDGLGALSATYHRIDREGGGALLQRGRLRYEGLHEQAGGRVDARIVSSRARAEVGPASGWITSASVDEHVIFEIDHHPVADVQTTVHVEARDVTQASDAFWSRTFDPARYVFGRADKLDEEATRLPYADRAPIEGLRGRSIDDVVTVVGALFAKKPQPDVDSATVLLTQYLRLDPRNAGLVLAQLHRSDLTEGTRAGLVLGLQVAGGHEAHEALRQATRDPRLSVEDRRRAVTAISEVPDPDAATIDALLALRRDGEATQAAQLGLGALAKNPRLDAAGKQRVLATLAGDLTGASDGAARALALVAAGNAADPALRDRVVGCTGDVDPLVQAEAYAALTKMNALPPPSALLDVLATAEEPRLESVLGEALLAAPLAPTEIDRCIALLGEQPAPGKRALLINLLGAAADKSEPAKAALVQQLHVEKDRLLLTLLGRYLEPADLL